jgi:phage terminase large subunit
MARPKQVVEIPYDEREQFSAFHDRQQRWACVVAHRRAGKTVACINDLIRGALTCEKPDPRFAYIAPHFVQAKDVAWTYIKQYVQPFAGAQINESELRVDLPNGGRVRLYGADNFDRMRGIYLDGVVLDEVADFDPRAWPEVIRPALSDRQGWAIFIGTPKGRNFFHQVYEESLKSPEWFSLVLRASETGIVAEAELADARTMMTPEQYAQEYEVSFDAAILGSYFGKEIADAEAQGRIGEVAYDPSIPVQTSWDLGMGDSTAIWFWQIGPEGIRILDYYENHGQRLDHYVAEINTRPYAKWGNDYVPHDARVRSLETGRTRVETLIQLGRKPVVVPDHKLMDGINAVRVSFPRIRIDADKCKFGLEALRQYRTEYDEKTKAFKNTPRHDWTSHAADAARYMAVAWREMVMPKEKPKLNVNTATPTLKDILAHHDRAVKSRDHKRI